MNTVYVNTGTKAIDSRIKVRDRVDLLQRRVYLLRGIDRLLMTMYLENGTTISQMARMCGKNPSTIYRRICKLTRLLIESEYITCLRFRDRFSKTEMLFAREHFLEGISYRDIAKKYCVSTYKVHKMVMDIRGVLEGNK